MGADYSNYLCDVKSLPSDVCVIHATLSALYGINLTNSLIKTIQDIYQTIWFKEMKIKRYCEGVTKFKLHKVMMYNSDNPKNSSKSKQMFCRFHESFYHFGWRLVNSPMLKYGSCLSSWFYIKEINQISINNYISSKNEFCVICLSGRDKFQFIDFPDDLTHPIIDHIRQHWNRGIKERFIIQHTENAWSIQLNGLPWSCDGSQNLDAKYLVLNIIRFMSDNKWRLVNSTALKPEACDTMFFRLYTESNNTEPVDSISENYFMLALMGKYQLTILGGNNNVINVIAESCTRYEKKGIHKIHSCEKYLSIELNSEIWKRRDEKEMETRRFITLLFQDLFSIGWFPIESIDCTRSIQDLSSLIFIRKLPVRMSCFCICPRKYSSICLINSTQEVQNIILSTFQKYYVIKPDKIKVSTYGIAYSIDFVGYPFFNEVMCDNIVYQVTLAAIIFYLKEAGWNLCISADTSNEIRSRDEENDFEKWSIHGLWFIKELKD